MCVSDDTCDISEEGGFGFRLRGWWGFFCGLLVWCGCRERREDVVGRLRPIWRRGRDGLCRARKTRPQPREERHSEEVTLRRGQRQGVRYGQAFMVAGVVGHYRIVEFWSQEPLSFLFQNTRDLKIWSKIFEKMAVFCRKFVQKLPNLAFFGRALCKFVQFGLIYSKNADNRKSFEFRLATITTGSLRKSPSFLASWVFSKMLKKAWHRHHIFIRLIACFLKKNSYTCPSHFSLPFVNTYVSVCSRGSIHEFQWGSIHVF